jgi:hypothetical protein
MTKKSKTVRLSFITCISIVVGTQDFSLAPLSLRSNVFLRKLNGWKLELLAQASLPLIYYVLAQTQHSALCIVQCVQQFFCPMVSLEQPILLFSKII